MSHGHTQQEIQLSQDRRDKVINFLMEWLTGPDLDSKTIGHFAFIASVFGVDAKVKELCAASSIQGRQEMCITFALSALNLALDDSPPVPSQRQLDRQEAKEAELQFAESLGALTPLKKRSAFSRPLKDLSPDELAKVRASRRERQQKWREKQKADNSPGTSR